MNKPRVIRDDTGQPAFAVIPWRGFERMVGTDAETMLSDEEFWVKKREKIESRQRVE